VRAVIRLLRPLWAQLGLRPPAIILLISLGLFAALSEGLSITLIVPLIAGQGASASGFLAWISGHFADLPPQTRVLTAAMCILVGVLLKNLLCYAYSLLFNWLNTGVGHRLRSAILSQVLDVGQEYLDAQPAGKLVNTLGTETWRVANALSVLADMLINLCMAAIFGMLLLALSWKLTLIAAVFFLLVTGVTRLVTAKVRSLGREAVTANSSFAERMMEAFNGLRVIRLFGNERWEQERFDAASLEVRRTFFRVDRLSQLVHPISEVLTAVFLVIVLVTATANRAEFAGTVAFLLLLYRLQTRVKTLDSQRVTLEGLTGSLEEVAALLRRDDKPYLASGHSRPETLAPGISFEGVTLAYPSRANPALADLTLLIPAGKTTALIGTSGAGKTTVASLVFRLYDPTEGRITAGGTDLKDLDLAWWRSRLAVVSQDVHLFDATVEENIAYGKPGVTPQEVTTAARQAQALEFILALPEGFATRLGERGLRLSGGQKQRIALARALVRNPDILLLDEATNALDLESERLVQDAIEAVTHSKTVLVIAHRINTVESADQIIVLEGGRVVESGSPSELAAAGGAYARLRALQYSSRQEGVRSGLQS
jgi:subfamily B ATP-binding cassette protein MsbA